jgi:hydroxymethylpyrimidine/phosphomethylpyrimidine kinase
MTITAVPRILIIAGSDSGGGAGIQADIKTVMVLGGHAMTAITAITAQNTVGVDAIMPVPVDMVLAQIEAVISDIGVDAVKIGMLGAAEVAHAVADRLETLVGVPIVFDPVMVATSGSVLADEATVAAFGRLMRLATLTTPNAAELQVLGGDAARLARETGAAVLAKGGDRPGNVVEDVLFAPDGTETRWSAGRIDTPHTHGTGCTLASAIAVGLAEGHGLAASVQCARRFVREAMLAAPGLGAGNGPMGHDAASSGQPNLNQVTVPARDYVASVAFYRALGLTQIVDVPPRYARFECAGGATLSIHVGADEQAGDAVIYFESADLDAWVERALAAGLVFDTLPAQQGWLWREARLRDPAGNRLCLYFAGENRRFPPWRVGGRMANADA